MNNFHYLVCCSFVLLVSSIAALESDKTTVEEAHFLVIKEDVIPDVENTTQKVIRVNPLDLPAVGEDKEKGQDSSLYNIQSLHPARKYMNSNRMRKVRPRLPTEKPDAHSAKPRSSSEMKFEKPGRKKEHLKFLYNQPNVDGHAFSKQMKVRVAPGAYPVYYTVAKVNGKFGKFPIKSFRTPSEFMKYLLRSKTQSIDLSQRYHV